MVAEKGCCGMHVITSAKVISLVGTILSCASLLSCTVIWIYTPISFAFLLSFILLIIGVKRNRPILLLITNFILV
uniref:NADH dehydrogenase subunit 6 n=1 Tax=Panagrolaimus sp. PS1159 TaxID=55785 RepID=A0AC35GX12_9BILA